MSLIHLFHRVKQMLSSHTSSSDEEKSTVEENSLHMNMGRIVNKVNNHSKQTATNERRLSRKRSSLLINGKLTYKIVIERIVKRFLLYYTNRHDSTKSKELEFRAVKNDIASFRFEVSYLIDRLDETNTSLIQSTDQFNKDLKKCFDFDKIKQHLQNHPTKS